MTAWDANSSLTIARDEAIAKIKDKAVAEGYTAGFKVVYDGTEIDSPADLPAQVDMAKVVIANKLNNAS